ncbi:MAG TPA: dihydropteroate synthase [Acidimicrobiia bacterium]|nr:dihydropteroate synthase [Acidimicrobiia bacterium]
MRFRLGDRVHDVTDRALVMGILNRTPDSFFDAGETFALDALFRRAEQLVAEGADVLDVGGVKAGPGPEVTEAEELDRVVPALEALHTRFDTPLSVDTWRAAVLAAACAAGAVLGNDISGFADPDYLPTAAKHRASVVATHIRLAPREPDPEPGYDDLLGEVGTFLLARAGAAEAAGLAREQIALDLGLDLGKTPAQSAVLLRESDAFASLGYTLLLSASSKRFLGELLDLAIDDRGDASLAAVAFGVMHGCRIVRVHDVAGSVRVCRMVEAVQLFERDGARDRGMK